MDNAVALVQAYLRLNGYLTVTEFPVLVEGGPDGVRTLTDLDVLAFRFASSGPPGPDLAFGADPTLMTLEKALRDKVDTEPRLP